MVELTPVNETDAEEIVAPAGFAAGGGVDALLNSLRAKTETGAAARHAADQEAINAASTAFSSDFEEFLAALKRALGDSISRTSYDTALANGSLEQVSNTVKVTGGIDDYAEFTAKDGGSKYHVTPEGVFHDDATKDVSPEEAFNSARLIDMNAKAHKEGITISGNDQQKAMYYMGYLDLQSVLGDDAPKLLNKAEMEALDPAVLQQAKQEYGAFKAQQEVELKAETDKLEANEKPKYFPGSEEFVTASFGDPAMGEMEYGEQAVSLLEKDALKFKSVRAAKDRTALIKAATAGKDRNPQVAAQDRIKADPQSAEEIIDSAGNAAVNAGANKAMELGRVPRTMYKALTSHIQEAGVATNKSIRSFLEEQGVPSKHISKVTKDAIRRVNNEDFITLKRKGNSPVYNRIVNVQEDFAQAAAPQTKTSTLKLTDEERVIPEEDTTTITADLLGDQTTLEAAINADTFDFGTTEEVTKLSPTAQNLYDDFKAFASEPPDVQNIFKDPAADIRSQMLDFLKERGVPENEARRTLGDFAIRMGEENLLDDNKNTTIINEDPEAGLRRTLARMPSTPS